MDMRTLGADRTLFPAPGRAFVHGALLTALLRACREGISAEVDVCVTKDGKLVLKHVGLVRRFLRWRRVSRMTLAELQDRHPEIPTLEEAIDLIVKEQDAGYRLESLMLDLKAEGIAAAALKIARPIAGRVIVASHLPGALREAKQAASDVWTSFGVQLPWRKLRADALEHADVVGLNSLDLLTRGTRQVKGMADKQVVAWTPPGLEWLLGLLLLRLVTDDRVAAVITRHPSRVKDKLDQVRRALGCRCSAHV